MLQRPAKRHATRAISLVVGFFVALALSHPAAAQWDNDFTNPKRELLRPDESEILFERIDLDADQRAIFTTLIEAYRSAHRERIGRIQEGVASKGPADGRELSGDELRRKSLANWRELLATADAEYEARGQLQSDLRLIVREDQIPEWDRFWRDHRRWTLRPRIAHFYESRIDLVAWWDALDMRVADHVAIGELLDQYADEMDPLVREYYSRLHESIQKHIDEQTARLEGTWRAPRREATFPEDPQSLSSEELDALNERIHAETMKRRIERFEPVREAERRIRDCNRKYVELLAFLLPPELAQDVPRRYLAEAYVWLFHNPDRGYRFHGHAFFGDVLALPDLDRGLRASIEGIRTGYERRFDAIALEVVRIARDSEDDWKQFMRDSTLAGVDPEAARIQAKFDELFESRRELQETTIATVRAMLTPEQQALIPPEAERDRSKW